MKKVIVEKKEMNLFYCPKPEINEKLLSEYPFLESCYCMAKYYNDIPKGIHRSDDGKYTIEKVGLYDTENKRKKTKFPTGYSRKTGNIAINDNLKKLTFSGLFFALVWAFIKLGLSEINDSNLIADIKAFKICARVNEFSKKDFYFDYICWISEHPTIYNKERIEKLSEFINDYIEKNKTEKP